MSDLTAHRGVGDLAALGDADVQALLVRLEREEQLLSRRRTTLHSRIEFVRGGGFASADAEQQSVEALQTTEAEVSEHRVVLHAQIDAVRGELSRRRL